MNQVVAEGIVGAVTIFLSIAGALFVSGVRYGAMKTDLQYIRRDIDTIMKMFDLTIRTAQNMKGGN